MGSTFGYMVSVYRILGLETSIDGDFIFLCVCDCVESGGGDFLGRIAGIGEDIGNRNIFALAD